MDIRRDLLKRDSQIALYRQLKDWVVGEIARGMWATGSLLPSERALGTELGVSRITVRQALRELVQEGVLESVPGKGFFVAARPSHALHGILSLTALAAERGLTVSNRILSARRVPASLELARRLGADIGTALLHIARLRLLDGVAVTIQRLWLPEALCPGLLDEDLEIASIPSLLSGTFGIELEGAEATIGARPADADERRLLELAIGASVLTVDRRTLGRGGEAVELALSAHDPSRLAVNLVQERRGATRVHLGSGGAPFGPMTMPGDVGR